MSTRTEELNRILIEAALKVDSKARLSSLCKKAGLKSPAVRAAVRRGYFTVNQVDALTKLFGDDLIPREFLLRRGEN